MKEVKVCKSKRVKGVLAFVLLYFCTLLPSLAEARDIWVHPSGSDANPCTDSATPLSAAASRRFIQGLNTCSPTLGPDDVVHVNSGTYTGIQGTTNGGTLPSGTPGHPITFVSVTQYGATVPWIAGNNYWTIDGFTVNGFLDPINDCVALGTSSIFKNSEIKNCSHQGLSSTLDGILIQNNIIHHVALSTNFLDHGIYLHGDNNIVENNEIYDINGGWGVQFFSGTTSHNIVRFNKIYDFTSGGIVLSAAGGTDNRVYGNRIYNGRVGNSGAITNVTGSNHLIYNNTFYNTAIGVGDGSASGVIIRNNIFNNVATPVGTGSYTYSNNTCDSIPTTGCASAATAAQLFANVSDLTFVLKTTVTVSPAIDAGIASITTGVTIPACGSPLCYSGTAPDRGAMESGVGSPAPPVVTIAQPAGCTGNSTACTTTSATITVTGTTTSGSTVLAPTWSCDRCGSGTGTGTTSWTIAGIALKVGINIITVTETDSALNASADIITITYAPTFPGNSLVLAMPFENGSGSSATDTSGNSNTGTLVNSPTWAGTSGGRYGNAIIFNGSSQYVSVADSNTLDLTHSFTITAWVQPTATSPLTDFRSLVYKQATPLNPPYQLYASVTGYCGSGGIAGFANVNGASGPRENACAITPLQINVWTHLAVTYDGTTITLYKNGVSVATKAQAGYMEPSTGTLLIGASEFGEYFQGLIDELRIYNFALPLTGGANTVFGNNCTRGDDIAIATASIIGNANCPITAPVTPVIIKVSAAAAGLKIGSGATAKLGSQ